MYALRFVDMEIGGSRDLACQVQHAQESMGDLQFPNVFQFVRVPAKGPNPEGKTCIEVKLNSREEFEIWLSELSQKNIFFLEEEAGC